VIRVHQQVRQVQEARLIFQYLHLILMGIFQNTTPTIMAMALKSLKNHGTCHQRKGTLITADKMYVDNINENPCSTEL